MRIENVNISKFYINTFKAKEKLRAPEHYPEKPENMSSFEFDCKFKKLFFEYLDDKKEELYEYLDRAEFDDGTTLLENLKSMFKEDEPVRKELSLLHKTYRENFEKIKTQGFDPDEIRRTEYGPGFYFGENEGKLIIYSGGIYKVPFIGKMAQGKNLKKYNAINTKTISLLRNYLKIPSDYLCAKYWEENEILRRFVNEYARNKIVNDLGIDGASVSGGEGYFIIFNPETIKGIEMLRCSF